MSTPGYSGKPLAEKLGLKHGMVAVVLHPPDDYRDLLKTDVPIMEEFDERRPNFIHLFATDRDVLESYLLDLFTKIESNGMLWVSWPKKTSKIWTSINENVVREICLPLGWVDVKVCAVTEIWSGLKLVIRREFRPSKTSN